MPATAAAAAARSACRSSAACLLLLRSSNCCLRFGYDGGTAAAAWWCRRMANLSLPSLRDQPPTPMRSRRRQRRDDEDDDSQPAEALLGTCRGWASRVFAGFAEVMEARLCWMLTNAEKNSLIGQRPATGWAHL
uniref:Uncharacterized protein n=1 Tax=Oryza sativa subsp. japonica TaxID=39947 RepID=Q6Z0D1_ORYSJ|nr:hypothetical protein [Oryza sativa Japonica Group]BAD03677.1 hypothetical protein [Oryza sativa Japonica Group]